MGQAAKVAILHIIPLLKDPNAIVRSFTAQALGEMGEPAKVAIPYLISLLKDSEALVCISSTDPASGEVWLRLNVIEALGKMGEFAKVAISHLIPLLKDPESDVRDKAAETLGKLGYIPKRER
jgi:HEAT repeat protein